MGFITNQWLTGSSERPRSHFPVKVEITSGLATDSFSQGNNVIGEIYATQPGGSYQIIYITKAELNVLFTTLADGADINALQSVVFNALLRLDDAELLRFIEKLFSKRAAKKSVTVQDRG